MESALFLKGSDEWREVLTNVFSGPPWQVRGVSSERFHFRWKRVEFTGCGNGFLVSLVCRTTQGWGTFQQVTFNILFIPIIYSNIYI